MIDILQWVLLVILGGWATVQQVRVHKMRALPGPTKPPVCSHIDAKFGTWTWMEEERRPNVVLYCTDCGEEFKYKLPIRVTAKPSKESPGRMTGNFDDKQMRQAMRAQGWQYDEESDLYLRIR